MATNYPNGRGIRPASPANLDLEGLDHACSNPFPTLCGRHPFSYRLNAPNKRQVCTLLVNHDIVSDPQRVLPVSTDCHFDNPMVAILRDRRNQIVDAFRSVLTPLRARMNIGVEDSDEFMAEMDRMQRLTTCLDSRILHFGGEV